MAFSNIVKDPQRKLAIRNLCLLIQAKLKNLLPSIKYKNKVTLSYIHDAPVDYFSVYVKIESKKIKDIEKILKSKIGKLCFHFKMPNYKSRQDTIGLTEVVSKGKQAEFDVDFFDLQPNELLSRFEFVE